MHIDYIGAHLPSGSLLRSGLATAQSRAGGAADHDQRTARPGHRALEQQQTPVDVDTVNHQVLHGLDFIAHIAGHRLTLEHSRGGGGTADRAGLTVISVLTVRGGNTGETMTFHCAREGLACAGSRGVYPLAGGDRIDPEFLAQFVAVDGIGADYGDVTARSHARTIEVALRGLIDLAPGYLTKTDLDRVVSIGFGGPYLRNHIGAGFDDRDGNDTALLVPHLRHADLAAQQAAGGRAGIRAHDRPLKA